MVEQVSLEIRLETGSIWLMVSFCDETLLSIGYQPFVLGSGGLTRNRGNRLVGIVAHLGSLS